MLDIALQTKNDVAKERAAVEDYEKGVWSVWEELPDYLKNRDADLESQYSAIFVRQSFAFLFVIRRLMEMCVCSGRDARLRYHSISGS